MRTAIVNIGNIVTGDWRQSVIDGDTIWVKLEQDRIAEDGFRFI